MKKLKYITKLLVEGRIEDVKEKYMGEKLPMNQRLSQEDLDKLVQGDPSGNNKYLDWMAGVVTRGGILSITPEYVLRLVNKFHNKKDRLDKKDLYQYKGFPELEKALNSLEPSKSELKRIQKKDTDKIYEDDKYLIISPRSEGSSCYYGKGTKWCTSAKSNNQFHDYDERGVLIYIINKQMTKPNKDHYDFKDNGEGVVKPEFSNKVQFGDYFEDLDYFETYSKIALFIDYEAYQPNMSTLDYNQYEIYDGRDIYLGDSGEWLDFLQLNDKDMFKINSKVVNYFKDRVKEEKGDLNEDFDWVHDVPEADEYRFFDIHVCDDNQYNEETGENECIGGGSHFVKIPKQEVIEIWDLGLWDMGGPGDEGSGIVEWGIKNHLLDPYGDVVDYVLEITKKEYCQARGNYEEEDRFLCGDFINEDFDWVDDVPSLEPGHLFNEDDIVFDDDEDVKINILGNEVIIRLDVMEFIENVLDISEGYCEIYLKPFLEFGHNYEPYDLDGEYDSEEEKHIFSYFTSEQLDRVNNLLEKIGLGKVDTNTFHDESGAEMVNEYLRMIPTSGYNDWDNFLSDTLYGLQQQVSRNRWRSLGEIYLDCMKKSSMTSFIDYDRYDDKVILTYNLGDIEGDFSSFLISDLSCMDFCWTDAWYDDYDVSGYEDLNDDFDSVMESLEESVEDGDSEELETLAKLGFDIGLQLEVGDYIYTVTELTNDYKVVIRVDKDGKNLGKNKISLDELPDFLYNYKLFENKKI